MNSMIKPRLGVRVRLGHALARGLRGVWLLNEGRGSISWDLSGAGHTGVLTAMDPPNDWVAGPQGYALDFDGIDDHMIVGPDAGINLGTANACVMRLKMRALGDHVLIGHKSQFDGGYSLALATSGGIYYAANGYYAGVPHGLAVGDEVWLGVSRQGRSVTFYKNGVQLGTSQTLSVNSTLSISSIGGYRVSPYYAANMRCDYVYCWDRPLSGAEMSWLYGDPFCIVTPRRVLPELGSVGAGIHLVSGSADASSTALVDADVVPLADRPTGRSWQDVETDFAPPWLREALLNGMTDLAAKLGTMLTQGWFWMRRAGCSAVYRCKDPACDVQNAGSVAVVAANTSQIRLPTYLAHEAGSTCYYVVRRFDCCGQQDCTTCAQVCVHIGPDGQLTAPTPNRVFDATIETRYAQSGSSSWTLRWFYWPLDQGAIPREFSIYWDGGTGEIDFANAIAVVAANSRSGLPPYEGRTWYSYRSQPLGAGKYLFAMRAKDAGGAEGLPRALEVRIGNVGVSKGPDILEAETV